jgi:metal-dependent amidase/aminoacylase/carboxypeptidase family protein
MDYIFKNPCRAAEGGLDNCPKHYSSSITNMNAITDLSQELVAIRHDLHAHLELGYEEVRTSEFIAGKLEQWGISFHHGLAGTGIVATIRRGSGERTIGLRADMDTLPIQERNEFAHKSQHAGTMHGCGHDGHVTMLLGAAWHLNKRDDFDGTVHLIFQPAEEGKGAGARTMIQDGLFKRFPCDAIYGLHNWPCLKAGSFAVREGPLLASNNDFRVTIKGRGAAGNCAAKHYHPQQETDRYGGAVDHPVPRRNGIERGTRFGMDRRYRGHLLQPSARSYRKSDGADVQIHHMGV